jgi:myosin heavy subunit
VKNEETLEKHLLDSNPLLEAFGNAKTLMNNNSSRFGKFILVSFNDNGKICSAKIFNYFLEKSRIVKVHPNERNYHIFYQFLKGANDTERKKFKLKELSYFNYISKGCLDIDEIDDKMNFIETKECLVRLKFTKDEIDLIFSTLMGILYLGNIDFIVENSLIKINEKCKEDLATAIELLGSDPSTMVKILTMRSMLDQLSKKQIDKQMSLEECNYSRDVIAKTVYSKMFDWIIKKVNKAISSSIDKEKSTKFKKIGILDIFGFEVFEENSFEQLCINYANERLQQLFNNQILKMEQDEYLKEKIDFNNLIYNDNKDIVELIDNPQKSVFSLLDSQALLKNNNDSKFREQVYSTLSENKNLVLNKKDSDMITISHYAGEVDYNITGFIEKNNDQLNNDVVKALQASKNKLIKYLFKNKKEEFTESSPGRLNSDTLSKQFRKQLDELIKILSQSNPRYIKCIKPNNYKKPGSFQSLEVNRQLLYAGVLETVNIRKICLSTRILHKEFVQKYHPIKKGFSLLKLKENAHKAAQEVLFFNTRS